MDNEAINFVPPISFQLITQDDVTSSHGLRLFTSFQLAKDCLAQMQTTGLVVPIINVQAIVSGDVNCDAVLRQLECEIYQAALNEANGSPTTAARKLGMKHQTFIARLAQLEIKRKIRKRYHHLMKHPKK